MIDTWRLVLPDKTGRYAIYQLELIYHQRHNPELLSLFHRQVDYRKFKSEHRDDGSIVHEWEGKHFTVNKMHSYAYNFDGHTGVLTYFARHKGDFTLPRFRWSSESRDFAFSGTVLSPEQRARAGSEAKKVQKFLQAEREKAETLRERERCDLFLSPLERIVAANVRK